MGTPLESTGTTHPVSRQADISAAAKKWEPGREEACAMIFISEYDTRVNQWVQTNLINSF
jgi:hypothetical protein